MLSRIRRWFAANVPSDEQLDTPENDMAIRTRLNENLTICREVAQRRLAELHTTSSPLARKR